MPAKTANPLAIALPLCLTFPAMAASSVVDQRDQAVPPAPPMIEPLTVNAADTALPDGPGTRRAVTLTTSETITIKIAEARQ